MLANGYNFTGVLEKIGYEEIAYDMLFPGGGRIPATNKRGNHGPSLVGFPSSMGLIQNDEIATLKANGRHQVLYLDLHCNIKNGFIAYQ
jgi:hypothetical protein